MTALPVDEQIAAAIFARLTAQLSGVTVARNHDTAFDSGDDNAPGDTSTEYPFVNIATAAHGGADYSNTGVTGYTMAVTIVGGVLGSDGAAVETALKALRARVMAAVLLDEQWGGLAIDTREGEFSTFTDRETGRSPNGEFSLAPQRGIWRLWLLSRRLGPGASGLA